MSDTVKLPTKRVVLTLLRAHTDHLAATHDSVVAALCRKMIERDKQLLACLDLLSDYPPGHTIGCGARRTVRKQISDDIDELVPGPCYCGLAERLAALGLTLDR